MVVSFVISSYLNYLKMAHSMLTRAKIFSLSSMSGTDFLTILSLKKTLVFTPLQLVQLIKYKHITFSKLLGNHLLAFFCHYNTIMHSQKVLLILFLFDFIKSMIYKLKSYFCFNIFQTEVTEKSVCGYQRLLYKCSIF